MQPQYAALTGTSSRECPCEEWLNCSLKLAPASEVYEFLDVALKTSDVSARNLKGGARICNLKFTRHFRKQ